MYCQRCNFFNDDHAKFCNNCGAALEKPVGNTPPPNDFSVHNGSPQGEAGNGQPNFNYAAPYNTPYRAPLFPTAKVYTNVLPIVAVVLAAVSSNFIAIALAIVSVIKFSEYDKACRSGSFMAENNGRQSKNLAIAAIVVASLSFVLMIAYLIFTFCGIGSAVLFEMMDEGVYYYSDEMYSLLI